MKLIRNNHTSWQNAVLLIITVAGVYNYHFNLNWLKVLTHCVPVIYIELGEGGVATQTT
jgi:hypothetical protein